MCDSNQSECSSTLPMPGVAPKAGIAMWYPWPAESWELDSLLCSGLKEDWAARFASLGRILEELDLNSVGQAFNLMCLFEGEAWSLGVWRAHTRMYEWMLRQSPSFVETMLKHKAARLTAFQREMEVREGELAERFLQYPEG